MNRGKSIIVKGTEISLLSRDDDYFISITDMIKAKDGDFFIADWLRNRNTVEFLGIWESINNPNFNYGEFAIIRSQAGLNNYKISVIYKERLLKINYRIHTDAIKEHLIPNIVSDKHKSIKKLKAGSNKNYEDF